MQLPTLPIRPSAPLLGTLSGSLQMVDEWRVLSAEEDVGRRDSPQPVLRLSVSRLPSNPTIITEESQSQESVQSRRSGRHLSGSHVELGPASVAATNGSPSKHLGVYQINLPGKEHVRRSGRSHTSSPSPHFEANESGLSSEGLSSVARKKQEADAESEKGASSYALTPKDSDQSSFDSHTFSRLADDTQKRKLKQRLNIPKTSPTKEMAVDSQRSLAKQEEYLKDFAAAQAVFSDEDIKSTFEEIDMDQNGFLSADEVRAVIDSIGEYATDEEIEEMIRMLDSEGRGQVSFEEFYQMATGQAFPSGAGPSLGVKVTANSDSISRKSVLLNQSRSHPSGDSKRASNVSKHSIESRLNTTVHDQRKSIKPESTFRSAVDETRSLKSGESLGKASFKGVKVLNIEAAGKISKSPSEESKRPPIAPVRNFAPDEKDLNELFHQGQSEPSHTALISELASSSVFTPQTIARLVEVFERTAEDEGAELEYNTFLSLVNSRLPVGRQLEDDRVTKRIFSLLDLDGSGGLNLREFVSGLSILCRSKSEEQFKFVFRVFDADDDGLISKGELVSMLRLNTQSIQSDEQASVKADEILRLAGNVELMTQEGFLRVKDRKLMLVAPVQERARKIAYIVNSADK